MIPHGSRDGSAAPTEFSEDAAVAREMYRALEEGDDGALARCVDPQVRWVHPMVTRLPFDGTRRGLPDVLRAAYSPEDWERLVALKDRYDPTNLFRFNRNIPPSPAARPAA